MKKNTTKKAVAAKKTKQPVVFQTGADLKTALLIVSLLLNAFVLCIWITLQITYRYDQSLYNFFILR